MRDALSALHDFPQTTDSDIVNAVEKAVPVVLEKLQTHEIELKGKEERELFSHPDSIEKSLYATLEHYRSIATDRDTLKKELEVDPVRAKETEMTTAIQQIEERHRVDTDTLSTCATSIKDLQKRVEDLEKKLCGAISRWENRAVVLEIDSRRVTCAP
ncbi:MAG TPA: hypothetical protein VE134_09800, partial [Methanomicrobiales archaeon]|nr:hypothetical protein [Methanomicrobiales archaeon]